MEKYSDDFYYRVIKDSSITLNLWRIKDATGILNMIYIFESNYTRLKELYMYYQKPEVIFSSIDSFKENEIKKNILRDTYNFFSSAKSLLEHLEKFSKKQIKKNMNVEVHQKIVCFINEFNDGNFSNFIRQFRNYIIHEEIPIIHHKLSMNKISEIYNKMENILEFDIKHMQENNAFRDKKSKEYAKYISDKTSVIELAEKIYLEYKSIYNKFEFEMFKIQIDNLYEIGFMVDKQKNPIFP